MTRKSGFTLIELLVVIAIIAILAAIIFPVFMKAKESAYRSGDMSNMNAIRNALQLYRADQEGYPPQILGYATFYSSGPQLGQLIPASALRAALYPKRIDSIQGLQPAYDHHAGIDLTSGGTGTAVHWPQDDQRPTPNYPQKDLNRDGGIDTLDDISGARQLYGPSFYFCLTGSGCSFNGSSNAAEAAPFYMVSGFDVAEVKTSPAPGSRWELHYTLRWTSYALGQGGNVQDDPRQLIYNEPPDDTVVTWDSWFRDYDSNNVPTHDRKDFVLFLGGGARTYDSADVAARSWRLLP